MEVMVQPKTNCVIQLLHFIFLIILSSIIIKVHGHTCLWCDINVITCQFCQGVDCFWSIECLVRERITMMTFVFANAMAMSDFQWQTYHYSRCLKTTKSKSRLHFQGDQMWIFWKKLQGVPIKALQYPAATSSSSPLRCVVRYIIARIHFLTAI